MMQFLRKLFGMGGTPGINVGVGTSMICMWVGHAWFRRTYAIYAKYGCKHCGADGKVPMRPEGGGSVAVEVCPVCKGTKFDPENPPPPELLERHKRRKRRRGHDEEEVTGDVEDLPEPSWWEKLLDWWHTVRGTTHSEEPTDQVWDTHPWKKIKFNAGTCRRCGATQGAWTEPLAQVGILGRILRWLF